MTILVAVEHATGVVMATDRQVTYGDMGLILHESQSKFFRRGPYIIGTTGRLRVGQVLGICDDLPVPDHDLTDIELNKFMMTKFAIAAQEALKDAGIEVVSDGERHLTDSEVAVCIHGRAYSIGEDYSVMRSGDPSTVSKGVLALGSSYAYAYGAYHSLSKRKTKMEPTEIAKTMVEASIRWDLHCGGDIEVLEQSVI